MGLLTLMTGQPELAPTRTTSPRPAPESGGADFLSALLAAFGMTASELQAELPGKIAPELEEAITQLLGAEVEAEPANVGTDLPTTALASLSFGDGMAPSTDVAPTGAVDIEDARFHTSSSTNAVHADASGDAPSTDMDTHTDETDVAAEPTSAPAADSGAAPPIDLASATTPVAPPTAPAPTVPTPEAAEGVGEPDPTLDNVAPELREKIERVIERMRDEFGHEVTVVEGYRSPDRQAHLYAQGRTVPGKVNTWTQRSWHSEGRAADLMVDGSYDSRMGYARLQRIAREEGLRTLGSRDLGHVELPPARGTEAAVEVAPLTDKRFVGVAAPAAPAAVARVAPVAAPGQWVDVAPANDAQPTTREPEQRPTPIASAEMQPSDALSTDAVRETVVSATRTSTRRTPRRAPETESQHVEAPALRPQLAAAAKTPVTAVGAPSMLERMEQVEQIRDLSSALQPSRVSIRLDGAGSDSLRVGLLNRSVDAALDISDPATGALIRSRVADLHRALESRGLGLEQLSVNGVTAPTSGREGWLSALPESSADLVRPLFAGGSADAGRNQQESRDRQGGERMNQGGNGSNSSRRDERRRS